MSKCSFAKQIKSAPAPGMLPTHGNYMYIADSAIYMHLSVVETVLLSMVWCTLTLCNKLNQTELSVIYMYYGVGSADNNIMETDTVTFADSLSRTIKPRVGLYHSALVYMV